MGIKNRLILFSGYSHGVWLGFHDMFTEGQFVSLSSGGGFSATVTGIQENLTMFKTTSIAQCSEVLQGPGMISNVLDI